ncbi:MAG: radical SAM protein [Clostridia bacterium]|nr:radical SAM protein [Clostridia bacterium]
MEEEKKNLDPQASGQNQAGGNGGGRRRRRKKHKSGGGQGNNTPAQAQQAQQAQSQPQNASRPTQNNPNKPNPQKQGGGKKNKQKNQQNKQPDDGRKDTYAYTLDGNLYINLTNKCSNGCDFCVRNERASYYGNYLWLKHGDPTPEKVISAVNGFGDLSRFKEVVFCGFGEPTYKVAEMTALCDFFHEKGLKTRLNTNGQGNLINKRDIVPELKGKIDFVNISLNASCQEKYQKICRSQFKEAAFDGLIEFAKLCRKNGVSCRFSIVDCIGEEEVEACKRLAESVKIPLYVRKYIQDS